MIANTTEVRAGNVAEAEPFFGVGGAVGAAVVGGRVVPVGSVGGVVVAAEAAALIVIVFVIAGWLVHTYFNVFPANDAGTTIVKIHSASALLTNEFAAELFTQLGENDATNANGTPFSVN